VADEGQVPLMSDPLFMSPEHVDLMNERLEANAVVRGACAALPGAASMGYCLHDGPDGDPVHWAVFFSDTVRFSLSEQPCDLLFTGDWRAMIASVRAAQRGQVVDTGLVASGDETLLESLGQVLAVAQSAAVPATLPEP